MNKKVLLIVAIVLLMTVALVPVSSAAPGPGTGGGFWHTVRYGETLSSIGWAYGVNPYAICTANGLYNCNYIYAGQQLWIPSGGQPSYPCRTYHTVTWGQSLSGIAQWYGVNTWTLAQANGIYDLNRIYAGQSLCIPW